MQVDSHHHFWKIARKDFPWLTQEAFPVLYRDYLPEDLHPLRTECGIDRSILVQGAETVDETNFLLSIADADETVAGVVGWADLAAADGAQQVGELAQKRKLVSLRPMLQSLEDDAWILRPDITKAIEAIVETGLCFDALVFPRHLTHLRKFLDTHADLKVVIDHAAKPYIADRLIDEWEQDMRAIARDTSALCKLSGLATEASAGWSQSDLQPYVEIVLDCFGADRVMWGSDWPVLNVAGDYVGWYKIARSLTDHLSPSDQDKIFGHTAARFYGIELA